MNQKTTFGRTISLAALALALGVIAHTASAELVQGRDYEIVTPAIPTTSGKSIEVMEFFSWACSHCYEFYPHIARWEESLPKDVVFTRSPQSLGHEQWVPLARAYFVLEGLHQLKRLDGAVFKAVHEERVNLFSDDAVAAWMGKHGIDQQKFLSLMHSMLIESQTREAERIAVGSKIMSTPTIVVAGKYRLVGANVQTFPELFALLDEIIAKARAERAPAK